MIIVIGILRVIYAFYMGKSRSETPYVSIPLNTVVELTPHTFDCSEEVRVHVCDHCCYTVVAF